MTGPERTLWALLKRNRRGLHFRRQYPVGPFILDFYCAAARLCIEIDGPVHADQVERDARRTAWLWSNDQNPQQRNTTHQQETRPPLELAAIAQAAPPSTA
jgi:very-short-patch-repair endonuclease